MVDLLKRFWTKNVDLERLKFPAFLRKKSCDTELMKAFIRSNKKAPVLSLASTFYITFSKAQH